MAEKADGPASAKHREEANAAAELDVIAPERTSMVAGRLVTMREPTWLESIEFDADLEPVIETVNEIIGKDQQPTWGMIAQLMSKHREVLLNLMSLCSDCKPAWIAGLKDRDGQSFAALFWSVNGHFFGRRVLLMREHRAATERAGQTSARH